MAKHGMFNGMSIFCAARYVSGLGSGLSHFQAKVVEVSEASAKIIGEVSLPPNTRLLLYVEDAERVRLTGRVIMCSKIQDGLYMSMVRFTGHQMITKRFQQIFASRVDLPPGRTSVLH